jgi:hypothetical protein
MNLTVAVRRVLPVAMCVALFSMSPLAADAEMSKRGTGAATEQTQLRGTGFLIVDPRDSREQIKDRMRRFFSFEGWGVTPSEQRQTEIAREVDALFAADGAAPNESPEVSFEVHQRSSVKLFRVSLLSSEVVRQSEDVCPEDCLFRDLEVDSLHVHLTRPMGGLGDTVLVLKIRGADDSPAGSRVAAALPPLPEWLERTRADGVRPGGVHIFGVRVTLTGSED